MCSEGELGASWVIPGCALGSLVSPWEVSWGHREKPQGPLGCTWRAVKVPVRFVGGDPGGGPGGPCGALGSMVVPRASLGRSEVSFGVTVSVIEHFVV